MNRGIEADQAADTPTSECEASTAGPLVGIWWDDGRTCVALAHSLSEDTSGQRLIDSGLEHAAEWPRIARRFGKSPKSEYFEVPRGRVVVRRSTLQGVVYHGPATTPQRLHEIARKFGLEDWTAHLDDHYSTAADADALFEWDD